MTNSLPVCMAEYRQYPPTPLNMGIRQGFYIAFTWRGGSYWKEVPGAGTYRVVEIANGNVTANRLL